MKKKLSRIRRARQTRSKIQELKVVRLAVHRTNQHIYASIINSASEVIASASTLELSVRSDLVSRSGQGGNILAAEMVGKRIAEKALKIGISEVAFDRSGFRYHGRVKALAESARTAGIKF